VERPVDPPGRRRRHGGGRASPVRRILRPSGERAHGRGDESPRGVSAARREGSGLSAAFRSPVS
jgi:hypothetical protein